MTAQINLPLITTEAYFINMIVRSTELNCCSIFLFSPTPPCLCNPVQECVVKARMREEDGVEKDVTLGFIFPPSQGWIPNASGCKYI